MNHRNLTNWLFLLLIVASCSNKNKIHLTDTNCKEEVPVLGNFNFIFDKNLAPDSVLNEWQTIEYVKFDPPISGKFMWKNANELIFSPSKSLAPSTEYTAEISKKIRMKTKYSLGKIGTLEFHTPKLRLEQANAMWINRQVEVDDVVPELSLEFNYSLMPEHLAKFLTLESKGKKIEYKLVSNESSQRISLHLTNVLYEDREHNIKIKIDKGLIPVNGISGTTEPMVETILLPSPFVLIVQNVEAEHDGVTGTIKVYMSQLISESIQLKDYITLNPPVSFTTALTEGGFLISSEGFNISNSYQLTLGKGLKGRVGGVLKESYSQSVMFGQLEPAISFVSQKGVYLSGKGARNIELRITNVSEIKVVISKIYENNLLVARNYGYYPASEREEYYDEGEYYEEVYQGDDFTVGDVIYEETVQTGSLRKNKGSKLYHFDFADKIKDYKGIYHIKIGSTSQYYLSDAKFISLSDIGLIARRNDDKIYVFANSIKSATALSGVVVTAYGSNNQKIGSANTNSDGYAEIVLINKSMAGFRPTMLVAKTEDDFNYMPFNSTKIETSRFDVGGVRSNSTGLRAFIYGDRDIYRPGEKVNFSAIVRDDNWKSPGEIPVKVQILLPNGSEFKSLKKSLNDEGSMESSLELSAAAVSGHYTIELYTSNDVLVATKTFLVEEFMPDRIRVKTTLNKTFFAPAEKAVVSLEATNLFGPPAANRNYELDVQVKLKEFTSKKFPDYSFHLANRESYYDNTVIEGKTDENGEAKDEYDIPRHFANQGMLQADFYTTVFDETGRPVSRAATADIVTQNVFFGIKDDGYYYYQLNQPIKFALVALNKDDRPFASTKAHVVVIKHDYKTILSRSGSYYQYESQREDKTMMDQEITMNGAGGSYVYTPRSPGDYEVRVASPGSNSYVATTFYSYGFWGNYTASFEVNREGNIDIATDRVSYNTGTEAKILFKTPFNGRMLVTLENNEVVEYHYLDVKNRAASLTVDLGNKHLPNVYVTATLIKPHTETEMPLTVAHGYQSLTVEDAERKLPVSIIAEKSSRSKMKQTVRVKTRPGSKVTLSVVDEGILQITNYKTPDPFNFFYSKRALVVSAYDLYPLLLPEVKGKISSTGGDGYDLSKRVNPLPNKRVKLVANWSGITDAESGEISFDINIPQFSGELRMMVVAYKNDGFGSAEGSMKVADPVVISAGIPRFLSPGDTALIPVTITNTTAKAAKGSVKMIIAGALRIIGSSAENINMAANKESKVFFKVLAADRIDVGKITLEVSALGEKFKEETDITVRPTTSLQKIRKTGAIAMNGSFKSSLQSGEFIPGSASHRLVVSKSPVVEFSDQINYLVQYPYGCTEQTISAAFPQLYFADLTDLMNSNKNLKAQANFNVQEAIRKIKMRQLYNGAITLWDGEGSEHWWATVYATHFILEAKKAGFESDPKLLNSLLDYLSMKVKNRDYIDYYYNRNQQKKIAPKEVIYSLFVMALAGKPDISTMNYYKQNIQLLALDCRYLLSAAYAIAGDKNKFREMLPGSFSGEVSIQETGGSFSSDVRDEGLALYAILIADPNNSQIGVMAQHISNAMKTREYLSTQERSFGMLCLGRLAKESAGTTAEATIKVDGKVVGNAKGKTLVLSSDKLKGNSLEINCSGTGKMYYFLESEGINKTGKFAQEDNFIKVRKRFFDRNGSPLYSMNFRLNDLVIVEITLEKTYSNTIENIVITDMLPAAFEIENPRIRELPGMDWIQNESQPIHRDMRDDRINLFVNAYGSGGQRYYYALRVVSPGTYKMGPVMADAMYNGEIHSYNGGGVVRVTER
jgi:uncharacterized protein YfaS (alpha-2-macroglobulin family)